MTQREPKTVRVDPDVWDAFVSWVVDTEGKKSGEIGRHVENALSEYIDHGRNARIEEKIDKVLAHVSDGSATHTHTASRASETVEKAREIHRRIANNHGTIVKNDDLRRAIEDIAGADDRTVEKYQGILKRRELLFAHPSDSPVWTVEREKWASWCEGHINNNPEIEAINLIDDYGMTEEEYHDQVDELLNR